ncbi:hypothetical protein [Catenuloplanes indicus]|uniref:Uncharacterized protein n=1 Tax=Catenuloplanes indicus TaxID=137267 RepID=A0AAE3W8L6_9ACTN|nr:hypothetical protein [Catenuloplanes indicus]MDQ0371646.1 hypothetical protein [Catenuloplanes indicus]
MTTETPRRPSPRPRFSPAAPTAAKPAAPQPAAPVQDRHGQSETIDPTSTQSDLQSAMQDPEGVGLERETAPEPQDPAIPAITLGDRFWALYERSKNYWTPPAFLTQPQPSLPELAAYAKNAPWTRQHGPARVTGIWYGRLIARPYTAWSYSTAWLFQRPARAATASGLLILGAHTTPGSWFMHHIVVPIAHGLAWVLL